MPVGMIEIPGPHELARDGIVRAHDSRRILNLTVVRHATADDGQAMDDRGRRRWRVHTLLHLTQPVEKIDETLVSEGAARRSGVRIDGAQRRVPTCHEQSLRTVRCGCRHLVVRQSATDGRPGPGTHVGFVLPAYGASVRVERNHVVQGQADIHEIANLQGSYLEGCGFSPRPVDLVAPRKLQVLHVGGRDAREG